MSKEKRTFKIKITENLQLRTLEKADALPLFETIRNNKFFLSEWMNLPHEIQSMQDSIKKIFKDQEDFKKSSLEFGIFQNNVLIGQVSAYILEDRNAKMRYWIDQNHTGKGIMSQCLEKFVNYCFSHTNTFRIEAKIGTENIASQRTAEKANFKCEGTERGSIFFQGKPKNLMVYSYIKTDHENFK